jgi:hypothetical protein
LFRLNGHYFKLGQDFIDKVDNFWAAAVAALARITELHVAEKDVGQYGAQSLTDILKHNYVKAFC